MKRWVVLCGLISLLVPGYASAERLQLKVPTGFQEVNLLSGGTGPVLKHLRGRLNAELKAFDAQYNVAGLRQAAEAAKALSAEREAAYRNGGRAIGEEYIAKLHLQITKVETNISSESSLGEIAFTYTITNTSDRIVSDIVYTPRIGELKIPVASKLVLDLIDPVTLKFGLAPGRSLSNRPDNPERLSFLLGEVSKENLAYIKAHVTTDFGLDIQDIHFMNAVGYKDQSRIMEVEQAFPVRLGVLDAANKAARQDAAAKAAAYANAQALYDKAKQGTLDRFRESAQTLKKSAVRQREPVDKKGRCTFADVSPGIYYVYADSGSGMVVFQEVQVKRAREKVKIEALVKNPFLP